MPNCEFVGQFGNKGRGPNEFVNPVFSGFRRNGSGFIMTDFKKVQHIEIPKGKFNGLDAIQYGKPYAIPNTLSPLNNSFILNDSIICGTYLKNSRKELVNFNVNSQEIKYLIDFPKLFPDAPLNAKPNLYWKSVGVSENHQKIALLYRNFLC